MILSSELEAGEVSRTNLIADTPAERAEQMDQLLQKGLEKTERLAKLEGRVGYALGVVLSVKRAISTGLQPVPVASLAWTSICFALEAAFSTIEENATNRAGVEDIASKMKWYSSLSAVLLQESEQAKRSPELRDDLEKRILALYKELLKFAIMSVCAYYRNQGLQHLRSLVKFDDWGASLKHIADAEYDVRAMISEYQAAEGNTYLRLLFEMQLSQSQKELMKNLRVANMEAEVQSLQARKDILLEDSYKWVLDNREFRTFTDWDQGNTGQILWVKGDPGKGKTFLLMGIINELKHDLETHFDAPFLSYFFCQGANGSLNTATAVLKGLIWMLLCQERSLIRYLEDYNNNGPGLFDDRTSFYSLRNILPTLLNHRTLRKTYFVIDALDECKADDEPGLRQLLELISEVSRNHQNVRWLVSSRNSLRYGKILEELDTSLTLSLEGHRQFVTKAVKAYINHKMADIAQKYERSYSGKEPDLQEEAEQTKLRITKEVYKKAEGTFLWAALLFKQIDQDECNDDKILEVVMRMPSGLTKMYTQIMEQVKDRNDGYSKERQRVLHVAVNSYRPLHISEMGTLAGLSRMADCEGIVRKCGLLTVSEDGVVFFVHQSAKDFLTQKDGPDIVLELFPDGHTRGHYTIMLRSLEGMRDILKKDMYKLRHPGCSISEAHPPKYNPLSRIQYSCVYWIDHLCEVADGSDFQDALHDAYKFLTKQFLYWLEALSLLRSVPSGVAAVKKLEALLAKSSSTPENIFSTVRDANRFLLYHRSLIEEAPLQIYISAVLFSPIKSVIRHIFEKEMPPWFDISPQVDEGWSPCLQILEGHSREVTAVSFSPNGRRLASASRDGTIRLWWSELQRFEGHPYTINSVAFSYDSRWLISASYDSTIHACSASYGISSDGCWITWKGERILWLPLEYRPEKSLVENELVAIGSKFGRVLMVRFKRGITPV
ncbi:hypothetical protein BDV59DRAFT_191590 [Aspergillus ambiguus]|uniref:uncharacterized protein n=1 Tax=Aspergillus ambiguus TaxID=176160 RepID=UPI003CCDDD5B